MKRFIIFLLKPLSFLPAIIMMYIIFTFSAMPGEESSQLSYKVSYQIVTVGAKILDKDLSVNGVDYYIDKIHVYVRKLAHMAVYFCLAVAISFPLYVYGLRGFPLLIVAGLICFGFACTDEYHQSLVAGRGPSKRDVAIDCVGAFFGITLVRIVCYTALLGSSDGKKKKHRKKKKR
ncbi:VanZ family protein [Ruminococcus gauvreauii]|uniref:VanZ family protein n=1 Tax=Ruminococcus gauvreauii TaxID=438033 RepID=A0ABY5VEA0_9FIRM|nr:VanZ family protein [Ruminococcus gauvreauii]UWP58944.1 VanZ family protein [Ruminococcus gauvreauii]